MRPSGCHPITSRFWSTPTTPAPSASTNATVLFMPAATSIRPRDGRYCGWNGSRNGSNPLELQPRQPGVEAVGGDQRGVGALLDDAALVHHQDVVAGQHGGEAM